MTTEPRTIVLHDQREVVVVYAHHTYPDRDAPIDVTDVDPLPKPGTVVVGRLDQAPAKLSERLTACRIKVSTVDRDGALYVREYALPMSLDGLDWAVTHLVAELTAAMLDMLPSRTLKELTR
ncbi:hypothetical protein J1770_gp77 [Gordonia phage EMoore]|uniref:Uncharacterized protein n=1 Tax=Gordonia phage EMoore TaxID=2656534 RepID=A0A649VV93_9CAUD|nr:hypothetical protein J1770_gp77 [Gordonia phage EMoore]QGJ95862.1 hypothetical protein SEA_EMOORE_77 [Gordonia phage EMoore]